MCTSQEERRAQLRRDVSLYLSDDDFDAALAEALKYHQEHPPGELHGDAEALNRTAAKVIAATQDGHLQEHREALMLCFLRKNVPYELAGKIVSEYVLDNIPAG